MKGGIKLKIEVPDDEEVIFLNWTDDYDGARVSVKVNREKFWATVPRKWISGGRNERSS